MRPIAALDPELNSAAADGAASGTDPEAPADFFAKLGDAGWSANWAGGFPNILLAYDSWMYDDGFGSGNLDCTTPSAAGCWGHRHDILAFPRISSTAMGVAAGRHNGEASYAQLIVATLQPAQ